MSGITGRSSVPVSTTIELNMAYLHLPMRSLPAQSVTILFESTLTKVPTTITNESIKSTFLMPNLFESGFETTIIINMPIKHDVAEKDYQIWQDAQRAQQRSSKYAIIPNQDTS